MKLFVSCFIVNNFEKQKEIFHGFSYVISSNSIIKKLSLKLIEWYASFKYIVYY